MAKGKRRGPSKPKEAEGRLQKICGRIIMALAKKKRALCGAAMRRGKGGDLGGAFRRHYETERVRAARR